MFTIDLADPVSDLKGAGKRISEAFKGLGVSSQGDLILLAPRGYEDRSEILPIPDGRNGPAVANTVVTVLSHSYMGNGRKRTLKITVRDTNEPYRQAVLLCFNRNFLDQVLRIGVRCSLYGTFQYLYHELQCSQFEATPIPEDQISSVIQGALLPVYPLSGILTQRIIRRCISQIFDRNIIFDNEIPESIIQTHGLISMDKALRTLHGPANTADLALARRTLAFSELFLLLLSTRRHCLRPSLLAPGTSRQSQDPLPLLSLESKLEKNLPFSLTDDQRRVLDEIRRDLSKDVPMNRLLQGDVGSGKTLVAWMTAARVIQNGGQAAFMAPTELLAHQHAETAWSVLGPLGIHIAYLTGSIPTKERKLLLEALAAQEIDLVVGTHALFSEDVLFRNLRYVIIDEQHRFGVSQRISLSTKGTRVHSLMMTATPIPRTLALTVFGDLDISTIHGMPAGRLPVTTYLVSRKSRDKMYHAVNVEFSRGHQAYFVYPRIDNQGESNLRDVETMYKELTEQRYPGIPARLIHSRLSEQEKFEVLQEFKEGRLRYLVSTSVVEVGIDVPTATCMVVEHAERFGLSALHQLRGRVGRSTLQSYCFLVYEEPLTEEGRQRLMAMKESTDGFKIAELDLQIRGPGEFAGIKQSGFEGLRFASLTQDKELLEEVVRGIDAVLQSDPTLEENKHAVLRKLVDRLPPHAGT